MSESKVVLITGASSGIGKETAKLLNESGYVVYGVARRLEKMKDLVKAGVIIYPVDVTNDDSMIKTVEYITAKEGRIDILINNAGYGCYGTIEDVPGKNAKDQFDVNLFGLARMTQLVLPYMRRQGSGKIVNIASIGGKVATPLGGWYYASKFAVEGLSDSLRLEVKPFGIDVIIIEPGLIKTEWEELTVKNLKKVSENTAYGKLVLKGENMLTEQKRFTEPIVIARLIKKAITARKPKPRYSKGYMSWIALTGKKLLSDRLFDRIMMKILD